MACQPEVMEHEQELFPSGEESQKSHDFVVRRIEI